MGVPTSEVGYTSAMPRREDHEVHKRTRDDIGKKKKICGTLTAKTSTTAFYKNCEEMSMERL